MPREKNGNPKNPRKRGKWKPKGAFDIQQLPQALVMDILSRLSIKTLYNCRCVCKDWLHMICDPQFANVQCLRSPISILIRTNPRAEGKRKLGLVQIEKCSGSRLRVERMRFAPQNSLPVSTASEDLVLTPGPMSTRSCRHAPMASLRYTPLVQEFGEALEWLLVALPWYIHWTHRSILFCMELFIGFPALLMVLSLYSLSTLRQNNFDHFPHHSKDYGVQESWTKILVIENLYPWVRHGLHNAYEPIVFFNDGEILMTYKDRVVVRYNQETKTVSRTGIIQTQSRFRAIAYCPCFVSLHDVSNGEKVIRVRDNNKFEELFAKGSYNCAGSGKSANSKLKKLKSGSGQPALGDGLPNKAISSSS